MKIIDQAKIIIEYVKGEVDKQIIPHVHHITVEATERRDRYKHYVTEMDKTKTRKPCSNLQPKEAQQIIKQDLFSL